MIKQTKVKIPASNSKSFTDSVLDNRNMPKHELFGNMSCVEPPQNMLGVIVGGAVAMEHMERKHKIGFSIDYDYDGMSCGVVAALSMRKLGYTNFYLANNTRSMGFGLNRQTVDMMLKEHPDTKLIITADNGIVAFDAVDYANSLGIDVIITDHHLPDETGRLPNAKAIIDPHQAGETCSFKDLCGTGVLYKFMSYIFYLLGRDPRELYDVLDHVAAATVADVVPLRGENRWIFAEGIEVMNRGGKPLWEAFKKENASMSIFKGNNDQDKYNNDFTSKTIGYFIGPCINACSRMSGDIKEPLDVFLNTSDENMQEAVHHLVKVNEIRKTIQKCRCNEAMYLTKDCDDRFLVIDMPACEEGIVGLVAGRLCNSYYRPTIVLSKDEHGNWKGSGRSIVGVHIKEMLDIVNKKHPDVLIAYGGHSQACGLTVRDGKVDVLRKALNDYCNENFAEELFNEVITVDYVMSSPSEIPRLYAEQLAMEPFGCEFPEPVVMTTFKPNAVFPLKNGTHLKFLYRGMELLCWNCGHHLNGKDPAKIVEVTVVGNLDSNSTMNCNPELLQLKFAD